MSLHVFLHVSIYCQIYIYNVFLVGAVDAEINAANNVFLVGSVS